MNPIVMTVFLLVGFGAFAYSAYQRWRLMMVAKAPENRADRIGQRISAMLKYAIGQVRMVRYPLSGWAHILVFFGFLYTPIEMVLSLFTNILSRKNEFQADTFAVTTHGNPEAMVTALKKLSVDNLSNLTPHPLKVFLSYSHPPVLERIKKMRHHAKQGTC